MKISNKKIDITLKNNLIDSIKFNGKETLNESKKWQKKFPILFPALGLGNVFKYKGKEWPMPKHGFWNEIPFDVSGGENMIILNGKVDRDDYPAYVEVEQYISIKENVVNLLTKVTGEPAPMQIGYHPGFKVDKGDLKVNANSLTINQDGTWFKEKINVNSVKELDFSKVESYILDVNELVLENEKYDLKITTNMKYLVLWTVDIDEYICIEPYSDIPGIIKGEESNHVIDDTDWTMSMEYIEKG